MQREARAQTTPAFGARPRNTPLCTCVAHVSEIRISRPESTPKALRAEGYTEIVLWRSLNVVRRCYPGPGVVTVIGVIRYSDNSVIEITLVGTYCIQYSSRERNSGSSKLVVWAVAYRAVENRKEDEAPVAPSKDT